MRPEPSESAGSDQAIDNSVESFEQNHLPGKTFPDTVAEAADAVSKKCGYTDNGENVPIGRAGQSGVRRGVGDEDSHDDAVEKPEDEKLGKKDGAVGVDGYETDGTFDLFCFHCFGVHVFVRAVRKIVKAGRDAGGAQCGADFVLVGELAIAAAMIRQDHVNDGAGDKDENRG